MPGREEESAIAALHPAARVENGVQEHTVASDRLDDLVIRHDLKPGLIKVDVEGAEGLVFRGAMETLNKFRPVILSELSDPLLRDLGTRDRKSTRLNSSH